MHTGNVIVGNMGSEKSDQFTAIGPDVNIASRLEGLAHPGQIILSSTTESRIKTKYTVKRVLAKINSQGNDGSVELKHLGGKFELYNCLTNRNRSNLNL